MNLKLCLCTTPSKYIAEKLANKWVTDGLAACINIIPNITSIYRYNNKIENDNESLMLIKTSEAGASKIKSLLAEDHPYECPEWVELSASEVEKNYLAWALGNSL